MAEIGGESVSPFRQAPPSLDDLQSQEERQSSDALLQASMQARRPQVSAACQRCRKRKTKCDALRPCTSCAKRRVPCIYETEQGETYNQASKRKYDEMVQSRDTYIRLFDMLQNRSEREATELFRWVRSGRSVEEIITYVDESYAGSILPDPVKQARENFLVNLAHSTGSLRAVVRLASLALEYNTDIPLPSPEDMAVLRNRVVHLSYLETLAQRSLLLDGRSQLPLWSPSRSGSSDEESRPGTEVRHRSINLDDVNREDNPPYRVPAAPWTTITADDDAVSHLVSLFLSWINPAWRFVEKDIFLKGMRSQQLQSGICSPFLVNSICAIACLHSEHEIASQQPDQSRITRGQQFHDEAIRLWELEKGRPSIPNIQALCVLGLDCNYRAKDKLGLKLVPIAAELNERVPIHLDEKWQARSGISRRDCSRVRLATHWAVKCTHIIMRIAFLSSETTESYIHGMPKIHEVFDDAVDSWTGYPLSNTIVQYRPTLYLRERCRLAELFQEMHNLMYASDRKLNATTRALADAVDRLSESIQRWYQRLPFELHYVWPMSVAIWELHASYTAVLMILWLAARNRFLGDPNPADDKDGPPHSNNSGDADLRSRLAEEKLSGAIQLAYTGAQLLRDFRKRYGLKISPAWLLQLQAVTASVLLLDPALKSPPTATHTLPNRSPTGSSPAARSPIPNDHDNGLINDSHTAFDEVFRCLLGTAVEVMIARGIARMTYHTALEQKVALSSSTRSMLQIMSDTTWRPRDLSLVNSTFPNFVAADIIGDHADRMTDLLLKWEKLDV